MPGAQPRRPFETRVASTARRGAYAPPGVPGVYRVPRVTTVTVQAADPGAAVPGSDWVQPDDVVTSTAPIKRSMQAGPNTPANTFNGVGWAQLSTSGPLLVDVTIPLGGNIYCSFGAGLVHFNAAKFPPVSPTPPLGMSVEYENPAGELVSATFSGTITDVFFDSGDTGQMSVGATTAYEANGSTWRPTWHAPGDLSVPRIETRTYGFGADTPWSVDVLPADLTADDVYQVAFFAENHASGTAPTANAVSGESTISCAYTYTPPRYRFV
jgi:hypothetical protein